MNNTIKNARRASCLKTFLLAVALVLLTLAISASADESFDQEVKKLVAELSDSLWKPSAENMKRQPEIEAKLAALGAQALPVLEREPHLGIKFPELNEMLQAEQSHRWAVVTVLARIPAEKSTRLLYRSLFDPPDNFAMQITTLAALKNRELSEEMVVGMLCDPRWKIGLILAAYYSPSCSASVLFENIL